MKKHLITLLFTMLLCATLQAQDKKKSTVQKPYSYKVIQTTTTTFGYDIYNNGVKYIHQTNIPGEQGEEGFQKKEDAEKVARLVIEKLEGGEMLPTITTEDLKKMNIITSK